MTTEGHGGEVTSHFLSQGGTDRQRARFKSMNSASDGGRRSGSGAQGEQLRSEHLPPLLNFLEVGV